MQEDLLWNDFCKCCSLQLHNIHILASVQTMNSSSSSGQSQNKQISQLGLVQLELNVRQLDLYMNNMGIYLSSILIGQSLCNSVM